MVCDNLTVGEPQVVVATLLIHMTSLSLPCQSSEEVFHFHTHVYVAPSNLHCAPVSVLEVQFIHTVSGLLPGLAFTPALDKFIQASLTN